MKTAHERQEEKRQVKFAEIREQVEAGKLVIRKMTPEERKKFPPRPRAKTRRSRYPG